MTKPRRLQHSVQKPKCISKSKGRPQSAHFPSTQQHVPRNATTPHSIFFLRAIYRQAREDLARPQSAPAGRRSFRHWAEVVRRSSREVAHQHQIVKLLQDGVAGTRDSRLPSEAEIEAIEDAVKDNMATRRIRIALLNLEMPKDFRDVGTAVRSLQTITSLCKDEKLTLAELHATCAKLHEKNRELAAALEATSTYGDYARALEDEISKTVDVLRTHARLRHSGAELHWEDAVYCTASRSEACGSADAGKNTKEEECDEQFCDSASPSHDERSSIILEPIAPEARSGTRRSSCLSLTMTELLHSDMADEEKAEESSAGNEGNAQTGAKPDDDVSEFRRFDHISNKTLPPCPPTSPSTSPSMNPRLKHVRHVNMEQDCRCAADKCLPPVVPLGNPGISPSPRPAATKRRGFEALPPLSPLSARLISGDFAAYCALKEVKHHAVSPRRNLMLRR